MTIEKLTDDERRALTRGYGRGLEMKALRIIDQLTAALHESEFRACAAETREQAEREHTARSEAECRELTAECELLRAELQSERDRRVEHRQMNQSLNEQVQALESRLAAANALLELMLESGLQPSLDSRIRAHIAGQGPVRTRAEDTYYGDDIGAEIDDADAAEQRATRTEAEQRVLDAMSGIPQQDLRDALDIPPPSQRQDVYRSIIELCRAELARRGLAGKDGEDARQG